MKQKARVKERPNKTIEVYNTVDKRYFTQVFNISSVCITTKVICEPWSSCVPLKIAWRAVGCCRPLFYIVISPVATAGL